MDRGPGEISATALVCAPRVQHACVSSTGKSLGLSATKSVCHRECLIGGLNLLKVFALGVAAGCFFSNCLPITTPLDSVGMFAGVTLNALGPGPPQTAPRRHVCRKVAQKNFGLVSLQTVAACRTAAVSFLLRFGNNSRRGKPISPDGCRALPEDPRITVLRDRLKTAVRNQLVNGGLAEVLRSEIRASSITPFFGPVVRLPPLPRFCCLARGSRFIRVRKISC